MSTAAMLELFLMKLEGLWAPTGILLKQITEHRLGNFMLYQLTSILLKQITAAMLELHASSTIWLGRGTSEKENFMLQVHSRYCAIAIASNPCQLIILSCFYSLLELQSVLNIRRLQSVLNIRSNVLHLLIPVNHSLVFWTHALITVNQQKYLHQGTNLSIIFFVWFKHTLSGHWLTCIEQDKHIKPLL